MINNPNNLDSAKMALAKDDENKEHQINIPIGNIPIEMFDVFIKPYHTHAELVYEDDPNEIVYRERDVLIIVENIINDTLKNVDNYYINTKS